jgi:hypothetical protein
MGSVYYYDLRLDAGDGPGWWRGFWRAGGGFTELNRSYLSRGQWLPEPPNRGTPARSKSLKRVFPRKYDQRGGSATTSTLPSPSPEGPSPK